MPPKTDIEQEEGVAVVGTGNDPIGRYPAGKTVYVPEKQVAVLVTSGFVTDPSVPPPAGSPQFEPHAQDYDHRGRLVLDRPLCPDEAAAVDAHNRERYIAGRVQRFQQMAGSRAA
jgi:hypothetical protein